MAKIPKLSDITSNVPGLFEKFKSMLDSITGPGKTEATEEALSKESDPTKIKILELELLINQLNDLHILQGRTLHNLHGKYAELQKIILQQAEEIKSLSEKETPPQAEESEDKKNKPE